MVSVLGGDIIYYLEQGNYDIVSKDGIQTEVHNKMKVRTCKVHVSRKNGQHQWKGGHQVN